jgi:hypothetical protein
VPHSLRSYETSEKKKRSGKTYEARKKNGREKEEKERLEHDKNMLLTRNAEKIIGKVILFS